MIRDKQGREYMGAKNLDNSRNIFIEVTKHHINLRLQTLVRVVLGHFLRRRAAVCSIGILSVDKKKLQTEYLLFKSLESSSMYYILMAYIYAHMYV